MCFFNRLHGYISLSLITVSFILVTLTSHCVSSAEEHKNQKLLPEDCGNSFADRIIGGKQVPLGKFPWLVRLGYLISNCKDEIVYQCGGVLINEWYIITAAHCAYNLPQTKCSSNGRTGGLKLASIVLGEHNADTDPDCEDDVCAEPAQHFRPKTTLVHPQYNNPKFANDIALIQLHKKANLNGWVSPICLPREEQLFESYIDERAEVAGWGNTDISKPSTGSKLPMVISLPILKINKCQQLYAGRFLIHDERQMCVGGEDGRDSCGGDSGGPLMYTESYEGPPKYYALGLVSFGVSRCGAKDKPAVYTRIAAYKNWILDQMKT